jgi:hypothetical protein
MSDPTPPRSYYVPLDRAVADGIRLGLRWLVGWVADHPDEGAPLIVAPTNTQIRDDELLRAACKTMECTTVRSLRHAPPPDRPVLLLWPDAKTLGEFDERSSALCVVPWPSDPIDYWIQARGAVDVTGRSDSSPGTVLVSNPVVGEAMKMLTIVVNTAHLANYDDIATAIHVFQELRRGGEAFTPDEVHAFALANGWSADAAGRLRRYAEGVLAGQRYRPKGRAVIRPDALDYWRRPLTDGFLRRR